MNFEMTELQLNKIIDAGKSVPLIATNCGPIRSPQENANAAWKELGAAMGFDHMTVRPNGKGNRFFSAEPKEVACEGIELGDGSFTGCDQSAGDCPVCGL